MRRRDFITGAIASGLLIGCSESPGPETEPVIQSQDVQAPSVPVTTVPANTGATIEQVALATDDAINVCDGYIELFGNTLHTSGIAQRFPEEVKGWLQAPIDAYGFNKQSNPNRNLAAFAMGQGLGVGDAIEIPVPSDGRQFYFQLSPYFEGITGLYNPSEFTMAFPYRPGEYKGKLDVGLTAYHESVHVLQAAIWRAMRLQQGSAEFNARVSALQGNELIVEYEVDAYLRTMNIINTLFGGAIARDIQDGSADLQQYQAYGEYSQAELRGQIEIARSARLDALGWFGAGDNLVPFIEKNMRARGDRNYVPASAVPGAPDYIVE